MNLARKGDGSGFVADSEGDSAEHLALGRVRSGVAGYNSAAVHSMHGCQQCREQEQRCVIFLMLISRFMLKVRSQSHLATPP